jgi:hypothetical protein
MLGLVRSRACARVLIAVVFVAAVSAGARARADTSSEWINTAGSDWTDPTSWSTDPYYPNNGSPSGTDYQAVIDQPGTAPYTITFGSSDDAAVDGLTMSAGTAAVYQSGGTLDVESISISAGTYDMAGGVLSGATISKTGGTFNLLGGTLDDVTFDGFLIQFTTAGGSFSVTDGLSTGGGTLRLAGNSSSLYFDGASQSISTILLQGRPTTNADTPTAYVGGPNSTGPVTLTINSNATVEGDLNINDNPSISGNTLVNDGSLLGNLSNRALTVDSTNFINNGTAAASSGGILASNNSNNFTNSASGVIEGIGGQVDMVGTFATNSGRVYGTNAGVTITLAAQDALINYGSIECDNGAELLAYSNGTIVNAAGGTISSNGGILDFQSIEFFNQGTISTTGAAQIDLNNARIRPSDLGTMNLSSATIVYVDGDVLNDGNTFDLNYGGGNWMFGGGSVEGGTIGTGAGQELQGFDCDFYNTVLNVGTISEAEPQFYYTNPMAIEGNITGTGQTLFVAAGTLFLGGTDPHISNINLTGNGYLVMGSSGASSLSLYGTWTVDPDASLAVTNGSFFLSGQGAITNFGTISATASGQGSGSILFAGFSTITNGNLFQASGTGELVETADFMGGQSFVNNGTVSASNASQVVLEPYDWTNTGVMEATSNSLLSVTTIIGAGTNSGLISADNASLTIGGEYGGTWENDGTIVAQNVSSITFTSAGTNTGTVLLLGGSSLTAPQGFDVGEGTFEGNGTVIGSVTFDSDPSHYLVSIGGTGQGVNYDFTTVEGSVSLGGDLEILFANGFQDSITAEDVFTIMEGTISGSFENVIDGRVETADDYGSFLVQLLAGPDDTEELELSDFEVTPEPGGIGFLCLAACALRRRSPSTHRARSGRATLAA